MCMGHMKCKIFCLGIEIPWRYFILCIHYTHIPKHENSEIWNMSGLTLLNKEYSPSVHEASGSTRKGCISLFPIAVIKHHGQTDLRKSLFELWLQRKSPFWQGGMAASSKQGHWSRVLRAHTLYHKHRAECSLEYVTLFTLKVCPTWWASPPKCFQQHYQTRDQLFTCLTLGDISYLNHQNGY